MSRVKRLARTVSLQNPVLVEQCIYALDVSSNYGNKLFLAYQYFCKANNVEYSKPKNQPVKRFVINVPTEERINTVIACCGPVYSLVFSLSKYGLRPQEIANLTLRDIDLERGILTVPTSKMGNQRSLKLDAKTAGMLKAYVIRKNICSLDKKLFATSRKIKEK